MAVPGPRYRTANDTVSAYRAAAVTPNDSTVLEVTRALYVGGTGILNVTMADGVDVVFTAVPVGVFPIQVTKVKSTTTTATNIVAMY